MKPNFLLTILALNTLFLGASIATASSVRAEENRFKLSDTISKLAGLDLKYHSVVTAAIDRAVGKKIIVIKQQKSSPLLHVTAGIMPRIRQQPPSPPPQPTSEKSNSIVEPNTSNPSNDRNIVDPK